MYVCVFHNQGAKGSVSLCPSPILSFYKCPPKQESERGQHRRAHLRTILKYQCQYDTGLRNRKSKLSIYSFTKDGPVSPNWTWCCPSERWGLSWQAVGSWRGDKQGPLATNSKKNLVGREAKTQDRAQEAGH